MCSFPRGKKREKKNHFKGKTNSQNYSILVRKIFHDYIESGDVGFKMWRGGWSVIFTNSLNSCDLAALRPPVHLKHPPSLCPSANCERIGFGVVACWDHIWKSCVAMEIAVGLRASVQSFALSQPRRQYLTPRCPRFDWGSSIDGSRVVSLYLSKCFWEEELWNHCYFIFRYLWSFVHLLIKMSGIQRKWQIKSSFFIGEFPKLCYQTQHPWQR